MLGKELVKAKGTSILTREGFRWSGEQVESRRPLRGGATSTGNKAQAMHILDPRLSKPQSHEPVTRMSGYMVRYAIRQKSCRHRTAEALQFGDPSATVFRRFIAGPSTGKTI